MKNLRDVRQLELANLWINSGKYGIIYAAPRIGKCRIGINIFRELKPKTILIAYPDYKVESSWKREFELCDYDPASVTYTTYMSLKKHIKERYDIIVLDEVHLMSEFQLLVCAELLQNNTCVLGLTGTLGKETKDVLRNLLRLKVVAEYPIELAIKEGVITDYEIIVIKVSLDNKTIKTYGKNHRTEKQQFDIYTYVINKLIEEGKDTKFLRLLRMKVFQGSIAKQAKTKELLSLHYKERILVFCGTIKAAEELGIPTYHSKSDSDEEFQAFINGSGNHMAVIKIGNVGLTYTPLNHVIINYFDSNPENLTQRIMRATSLEYDTPDKIARIFIISTDESVELLWLQKALKFFSSEKIKYI